MPTRRAVIFDCDGVLVDTEPLGLEAFRLALLDQGIEYPRDRLTQFCGVTDSESMQMVAEETGRRLDIEAFLRSKTRHYESLVQERGLRVFEGVFELLEDLRRASVVVAVASSGPPDKIRIGLHLSGLDGKFDTVVSGNEVPRGKPAPDIFIEAARRCGADPSACVAVEDTPPGLRAARAAGMRVIAVTHTFPAEDLLPLCDALFDRIGDITASDLAE